MFVCSLPCFLVLFQINCFEPVLECLFTVLFGNALLFVNILPLCTSVCLFLCSTHCLPDIICQCIIALVLLWLCVPLLSFVISFCTTLVRSLSDVSITDSLFLSSYTVGLFNPLPRDRWNEGLKTGTSKKTAATTDRSYSFGKCGTSFQLREGKLSVIRSYCPLK